MKVIIDIPDNIYEWVMNTGKFGNYRFDTAKAIKNGTPLDDVKAEIDEKSIEIFERGFYVCRLSDILEILDNIGKENTNAI